ncbi:MAG: hypothetical protein GWN07_19430, partial [Actinobacteria bacterium]|nr:hypothetical protein [Actinomycetota bacterium]
MLAPTPTKRFIGRRAHHQPMDARLARYPFLSAARDAVIAADADLATLV